MLVELKMSQKRRARRNRTASLQKARQRPVGPIAVKMAQTKSARRRILVRVGWKIGMGGGGVLGV